MKLSNQFRESCRRYHAAGFVFNTPGRQMVYHKLIKRFGHQLVIKHASQIAKALSNIESKVRHESKKIDIEVFADGADAHSA